MRNHGWELPYHPLQTVAVAVFAGIAFSFYVFFIPFVGNNVLKFHMYAVFSPVVLAVFTLYVRCAACDPADPGVHQSKRAARAMQLAVLKAKEKLVASNHRGLEQSQDESDRSLSAILPPKSEASSHGPSACTQWLCLPFVCCRKDGSGKLNAGEQLLYCSICEAEISKNSKHCRACDKCVHGFDHHCRWLNNCVGTRNYKSFVALMVACLLLLTIVWTTGIVVLVRCFSHKGGFEKEIIQRLGSSFSRVPYIIIVGLLSLLAMLATIPLFQLFSFHLILIHKGITTYDYILAVREQEQYFGAGDGFNSLTSSPASSTATGVSGYSSSGALALQRGVFCTPPRMFVEHQQKVLDYSGDLESPGGISATKGGRATPIPQKKISVGINPWKLARITSEEATKAAAHAREASSIMRPIPYGKGSFPVTETEDSSLESSRNVSGEITVAGNKKNRRKHDLSHLTGKERWLLMKDRRNKSFALNGTGTRTGASTTSNGSPQSLVLPLPFHARNAFRCSPSRFSGELRGSYPGSQLASPDIFQGSPDLRATPKVRLETSPALVSETGKVAAMLQRSESDGYEASAGESGDENGEQMQRLIPTLKKNSLDDSVVTPSEKVSVWNDHPEENVIPRKSSGARSLGSQGSRSSRAESTGGRTESSSGSRAEANILKHVKKDWPELRDGLCLSPDNSGDSSLSQYNSPLRDSIEFQSALTNASSTNTPESKDASLVSDGAMSSVTPNKAGTPEKRGLFFSLRRSSSKPTGEAQEPTA